MALRQFVMVLAEAPTVQQVGMLFTRVDDLTVGVDDTGRAEVAFDRDGPTMVDAIVSAVRDLDVVGLVATEVCPDDDLVTAATVAERLDRPVDAVRRWATGVTGPGGFPPPVDWAYENPCYRWSEVIPWLRRHVNVEPPNVGPTLTAVNLALQLRALAPQVERIGAIRSLIVA